MSSMAGDSANLALLQRIEELEKVAQEQNIQKITVTASVTVQSKNYAVATLDYDIPEGYTVIGATIVTSESAFQCTMLSGYKRITVYNAYTAALTKNVSADILMIKIKEE